jgi:hypothetical protein
MKQEVKDNITKYSAENFQDIDCLISDFNHLIRSGAIEELYTTRNNETKDYIETVIRYKPEQNWI